MDEKGYTTTEILAAFHEIQQRYPNLYSGKDESFAFWVLQCQDYIEWKALHDFDKIVEQARKGE